MRSRRHDVVAALVAVTTALLVAACGGARHGKRSDDIIWFGGTHVRYRAATHGRTGPGGASSAPVARAVKMLQARITAFGDDAFVKRAGDEISFDLPRFTGSVDGPLLRRLTGDGRLAFMDWEANVLTPNGKTAASQLLAQDPTALRVSQGTASSAPGSAGDGSLTLYAAIKLAESVSAPPVGTDNVRPYPIYYAFAAPGSPACRAAARHRILAPVPDQPCYLAGPESTRADLRAALPAGISTHRVEVLEVPRGVLVLEAVPGAFATPALISDPAAQFYTLLDRASLRGSEITQPAQSTDQTGSPDVSFSFTPAGAAAFKTVTAAVAQRGAAGAGAGTPLNQHFAVVLDGELLTVPAIDSQQFPDGINGNSAEITGGFTVRSAGNLADELQLGVLPVSLDLIAHTRVPGHG